MSVMSARRARLFTAEDLLRLPSDMRVELVEGELRKMPPNPGAEHGSVTSRLASRVSIFVEDRDLGECFAAETGFLIETDPDTVIGPDWAFVSKERLPDRIPQKYLPLAPDIVLETRSPSDRPGEVHDKVNRWLRAGVRIVWELDLKTRTLTVHRSDHEPQALGAGDTLSGEDVLPGFSLPIRRLFRDAAAERSYRSGQGDS